MQTRSGGSNISKLSSSIVFVHKCACTPFSKLDVTHNNNFQSNH